MSTIVKIKNDYINKGEQGYIKGVERNKLILELYYKNKNKFIYLVKNNLIHNQHDLDLNSIKSFKAITEHTSWVTDLHLLKDGQLASCSDDKTIKIYNPKQDYKCDITIQTGHTCSIFSISLLEDNKIISYSFDETMKLWKINNNTYEYLTTLKGHSNNVYKAISLPNYDMMIIQ